MANFTGKGGTLMAGAIMAAGLTISAKVIDEIIAYLKERNVKAKSTKYYAQMLEAHPELKKEKPTVVARYWASLYHFAPYMAQDPLAAGAFIRQSLARGLPDEFGGPAPDTYSTLTGINESILKAKGQSSAGLGDSAGKARDTFATQVVKDYMNVVE